MSTIQALFMPIAVIVAAYLLGRSAEKVARTLRAERRPEHAMHGHGNAYGAHASRLSRMRAIASRQGLGATELDRRIQQRLGK